MLFRSVRKNAQERERVGFMISDVAHLPFEDESVDCVGMSFAFRNLTYKNPQAMMYMREIVRMLRHGGRFVSLESGQPRSGLLLALYHFYFSRVVPFFGWLVSKQRSPYRYLSLSITNFPSARAISNMLLNAGFRKVSIRRFNFGTVALHIATK
jgi:demethylmenaquinone methyltransferase/2-methoxy-6-polyprenyl-1,4-benzoquinol methylase